MTTLASTSPCGSARRPYGFIALLSVAFGGCGSQPTPADAGAAVDVRLDAMPDIVSDTLADSLTDTLADSGPACGAGNSVVNTLTFHRDRTRQGWDPGEPALSPTSVGSARFGHLWDSPQFDSITINGRSYPPHIFGTPLYVDQVCTVGGQYDGLALNLVFTATSNGYVYAVNAAAATVNGRTIAAGAIVWRARLGSADVVPSLDGGVPMGVLSTPIIDLAASPPRLYAVSMDAVAGWQAFALDLRSGAVLPGWPVAIDAAAVGPVNRNGPATLQNARVLSQRGALNLSLHGDLLYVPFGAYGDGGIGWLTAVDTQTPHVTAAFSGAPASAASANGGIWGPGGVSIDDDGTVCATTGNSPVGSGSAPHVWGQTLLCWDPTLHLRGTFTPFNYCQMDVADTDLGGSSPVLLPTFDGSATSTTRLMAFGGKQGTVYLIDRDHLPGGTEHRPACSMDPTTDASLLPPGPQPQFMARGPLNVFGPYSEQYGNLDRAKMRSTPAYFRDAAGRTVLYVSGSSKQSIDSMVSIAPSMARLVVVTHPGQPAYLATDAYQPTLAFINPGSPVVTSNGASDPVVWIFDENAPRVASLLDPATPHPMLYAIDGTTLSVLWHTLPNELFMGGKYTTVTAARGVVYIGTDRLQAFGASGP